MTAQQIARAEHATRNARWNAYHTDYRCDRPEPVTCEACGTRYTPNQHPNVLTFKDNRLIRCSNCK